MKSSIVILDQAAGQKQIAILDAYATRYEHRAIIAGTVTERNKKLNDAVRWSRAMKYDRSSTFRRMFTWSVFTVQALYHILTKYRNSDLLIITNPPLTIFITFFVRNTYDLLIFDLYPDAFHEYNYLSQNSLLYRFWAAQNKRIFRKARRVFTLSEGMKRQMGQYMDLQKIEVVPLWTDTSYLKRIPKSENWFAEELKIADKFTVSYSGNLGLTHPVEIMVELAKLFQKESDIFFLIIGGGHKYEKIQQMIIDKKLTNIRIMEWQPPQNVPFSMNTADVGLVTLDAKASHLSVPSKVFDSFAIGVPVIAIAADDSELAEMLDRYKAGKNFEESDLKGIKDFILMLKEDPEYYQKFSDNSLNASLNHTPTNAKAFV